MTYDVRFLCFCVRLAYINYYYYCVSTNELALGNCCGFYIENLTRLNFKPPYDVQLFAMQLSFLKLFQAV